MANQHERVCEAIRTQLEGITAGAGGYAYTPDAVHHVSFIGEDWAPDGTYTTVYYVAAISDTTRYGPSSCEIAGLSTIGIMACRKMSLPSENPSAANAERAQIGRELAADVRQCIYADQTFGSVARKVMDGGAISADYQRYLPAWAMVYLSFVVEYATDRPGR